MKAVTKRYITGTLMVLAGIMPLAPARAADTPVVKVNMQEHIQAGHVADGQRLGRGVIVFHDAHTGFHVWSDEQKSGDRPERYVLAGSNNMDHKLRIRLEGDDWQPDNKEGKGITLYSGDEISRFYIVVDGEQTISADRYSFQVNGTATLLI